MIELAKIGSIARRTIDQVVVNGEVDGKDLRIARRALTRIAFKNSSIPFQYHQELSIRLIDDERFIDILDSNYGYQPEITQGSDVRPTPRAIVRGTARLCTEEEYFKTFELMNRCAKAIILRADDESGIISQRQVGGILKSVDIRLDYDDYGGFFAFMDQDDRFHILEDGRVVLTDRFTGKIDDIKIAEHLPNLLECVTAALDKVVLNADDTFMIGTLLGALNADGHFIRSDQFRELYDCLKTIDRVERVGGNTYRIIDTTESGISGYAKLRRSHPIKERKSAAVTIQEQETQDTITKPKGPPTADELFSTNPDPYQKKTKRIKDPLENMIKSASNMNSGQQRHKYWQP